MTLDSEPTVRDLARAIVKHIGSDPSKYQEGWIEIITIASPEKSQRGSEGHDRVTPSGINTKLPSAQRSDYDGMDRERLIYCLEAMAESNRENFEHRERAEAALRDVRDKTLDEAATKLKELAMLPQGEGWHGYNSLEHAADALLALKSKETND